MLSVLLLLAQAVPEQAVEAAPDCSYDLDAMLELDRDQFDQDMDSGWRTLARDKGCEQAAAELIREWRHRKRDHNNILFWHEGQMRALAGETDAAVGLFKLTYVAPELDQDFGWNHYVSGTIAFLEGNRERLRHSLRGLEAIGIEGKTSYTRRDGTVLKASRPPNLGVLEAFERCWGKSYAAAYSSSECR